MDQNILNFMDQALMLQIENIMVDFQITEVVKEELLELSIEEK